MRGDCTRPCGRGGLDTSDGWCIAPPIFSFPSRRKRENGPCTVQKRKGSITPAGGRKTEARKACLRFLRMFSAHGVVRAGVLAVDAWTVRTSSLPLTWLWTVGPAPWSGHFPRDCPSINRTSSRGRRPRRPGSPQESFFPSSSILPCLAS